MPRVVRVEKARKDQGLCGRCQEPIGVGAAYVHWSFRFGGKHKRCTKPACAPRASDLTQAKYGAALAAIENAYDALAGSIGTPDDVEAILDEAAQDIRAVGEEYEEAAEAMGEAGEQNQERADYCYEAADSLEDFYADELDESDDALTECIDEANSLLSEAESTITNIS